jgi:predicted phosphodiesterase
MLGNALTKDFAWLHFSDLHFKADADYDDSHIRGALHDFLIKEFRDKPDGLPVDYVFITGDVANKHDYSQAEANIEDLLHSLGWSIGDCQEKVFFAIGNHDIDKQIKLRNNTIQVIRGATDPSSELAEQMRDPNARDHLVRQQRASFHGRIGRFMSKGHLPKGHDVTSPHVVIELPKLNLAVFNTCLTSCDGSDEGQLVMLDSQTRALFEGRNATKPTFAIGHHGRECHHPKEAMRLDNLFHDQKVDVYLCGHSHSLSHAYFPNNHPDIRQITCGALFERASKTLELASFMYCRYNNEKNAISVRPVTFDGRRNTGWYFNDNVHRKLNGEVWLSLRDDRHPFPRTNIARRTGLGSFTMTESGLMVENANWSVDFFN